MSTGLSMGASLSDINSFACDSLKLITLKLSIERIEPISDSEEEEEDGDDADSNGPFVLDPNGVKASLKVRWKGYVLLKILGSLMNLPPYPLPTHETLAKSLTPTEFEVKNSEEKDEKKYQKSPQKEFQRFISLKISDTIIPIDGEDP